MKTLTKYAFFVFMATVFVCLYRHWYVVAVIFFLLAAYKFVDDIYPDFYDET